MAELYPEILKGDKKEDDQPSCSAAEALTRQEPFINQNLAYQALAMLTQLLRHGAVVVSRRVLQPASGQLVPLGVRECTPKASRREDGEIRSSWSREDEVTTSLRWMNGLRPSINTEHDITIYRPCFMTPNLRSVRSSLLSTTNRADVSHAIIVLPISTCALLTHFVGDSLVRVLPQFVRLDTPNVVL